MPPPHTVTSCHIPQPRSQEQKDQSALKLHDWRWVQGAGPGASHTYLVYFGILRQLDLLKNDDG